MTPARKPLRAYANVLTMRLNRRLKRTSVTHFPMAAYVDPTLFCNLQCPACPTGLGLDLRPRETLAPERYQAWIDELGDYLFHLYLYNWGEPLLHKHTPEMVAYAKRKGMRVSLSTNLSLALSDDYISRLVASGLDSMVASIDGISEETYVRYRRRGSLALVKSNLRRIREARDRTGRATPRITWQFLVFRHNEHELADLRARYRDWGADDLALGGAQMPAPPHDARFEPSTLAEYDRSRPDHADWRKARANQRRGHACSWLYGITVLNPNGSVSPCCAVPSQTDDFGTIDAAHSFAAVWNNAAYQAARGLFRGAPAPASPDRRPLICERCPMPFRQDDVDGLVSEVARTLGAGVRRERVFTDRVFDLFAWLVMGAPRPRAFVSGFVKGA